MWSNRTYEYCAANIEFDEILLDAHLTRLHHISGPDPTNITCTDGDIQLRNGASMNEGRVEVCYDDQWAPVCDPGWNSQKATVTCRQLGLVPYGKAIMEEGMRERGERYM